MLGTEVEVVTSKTGIAGDSDEEVRSTRSKRKRLEPDPFDDISRMSASSKDSSVSSDVPAVLGDDQREDDALTLPSPPPSPPPPPPPMTIDSNSPPPPGTEYYYPALDALQNMPHLSEQEESQLLLLEILDGCPNYVYDKVISHIESNLGSVYTVGVKLYWWEPLLSRLSKNFPVPSPQDVIVPLETNEEEDVHRRPGSTIVVPWWDFKEVATDFLLCPVMFGNTNNLVNKTVPFGKHPGPTDGSDREILDSYWYCKTYDKRIGVPLSNRGVR
jgi:hypothetical protein